MGFGEFKCAASVQFVGFKAKGASGAFGTSSRSVNCGTVTVEAGCGHNSMLEVLGASSQDFDFGCKYLRIDFDVCITLVGCGGSIWEDCDFTLAGDDFGATALDVGWVDESFFEEGGISL